MGVPLVLCYHAVSSDWPASLAVSPENFRAQLESLVRSGYDGVTFSQMVAGETPPKAVAVTFDDGYRSVYEQAFPILTEVGFPATVFVPTALVGQSHPMSWPGIDRWSGTPYERELNSVSWDELRRWLTVAGRLVLIPSPTQSFPSWTTRACAWS